MVANQDYEIWHENVDALTLFLACETQWRVITDMCGRKPQGLEYGSLKSVMEMTCPDKTQWPQLFEAVRLIERGALNAMREAE